MLKKCNLLSLVFLSVLSTQSVSAAGRPLGHCVCVGVALWTVLYVAGFSQCFGFFLPPETALETKAKQNSLGIN